MNQEIIEVQRLTLYDPLQLDETSFKQSFIARQKELNRLMQRVREAGDADNSHSLHTLIYAHRGMGKTSLLRRIALAVNEDEVLNKQWIALNFREEQYNLTSLNQLWKNCADPLAGWCEDNGDSETADYLDDLIDSRNDCDFLSEIKTICDKHQRRLLLLIDNLNLILDNLSDEEQWQWRGELQGNNAPLLIACTASMPEQLSDEQAAFFEFFRIQQLQPLSEQELTDCLKCIAERRGDLGQKALREIDAKPAKIKALHRLCGGNPRTLMIIYQAIETLSTMTQAQTFQDLLNEVLENVTALYKARTEELAPQQRQIVDAIALNWNPISLAELAEITGLKNTSLSSQIKRLVKSGVVEKSDNYQSKSLYQLAERFYNIWYLMRNGSRRHKRKLIWFSHFFTAYYSQDEVIDKVRQQRDSGFFSHELTPALIDSIEDSAVKNALLKQISLQVLETVGADKLPDNLKYVVDADAVTFVKLKRQLEKNVAKVLDDPKAVSEFVDLVCGSVSLRIKEKISIANANLSLFQIEELHKVFTDERSSWNTSIGKESFNIFSNALRKGFIIDREDTKGIVAYSVEKEPNLLAITLGHFWKETEERLLSDSALCEEFKNALAHPQIKAILPSDAWHKIGCLFQEDIKDYNFAKEVYLQAVALDESNAISWLALGWLRHYYLKDYDLAKQAYLTAIDINKSNDVFWNSLGILYQDHFKNYTLAKEAYLKALSLNEENYYAKVNLVWLGIMTDDEQLINQYTSGLDVNTTISGLINAALAARKNNIGDALEQLKTVLENNDDVLWIDCRDDLLRLVTLFHQRGFYSHLLDFLYENRFNLTLAPFVIAVETVEKGEDYLKTINPEMRPEAESMYHYLASLLAV